MRQPKIACKADTETGGYLLALGQTMDLSVLRLSWKRLWRASRGKRYGESVVKDKREATKNRRGP